MSESESVPVDETKEIPVTTAETEVESTTTECSACGCSLRVIGDEIVSEECDCNPHYKIYDNGHFPIQVVGYLQEIYNAECMCEYIRDLREKDPCGEQGVETEMYIEAVEMILDMKRLLRKNNIQIEFEFTHGACREIKCRPRMKTLIK